MPHASTLPDRWWETCSCVSRVFSKRDHIPLRQTLEELDAYHRQGIGAIELFAPYHGGNQYGALDPYNFFIVDPDIGTMADFLALVDACHQRQMAVIIFINVGYAAMANADFLKAQDDVRRGIDSRETSLFLWDDSGTSNVSTLSCCFGKPAEGHWVYSERAGKHYWVKWHGFHNDAALPQYNFASIHWQEECKKIIRFWMETGIDGIIIDAPYSYANCDFAIHDQCISSIVQSYPNQYFQPEGGGAAGEALEPWLVPGRYNSLQDYALCPFWEGKTPFSQAIATGDVTMLEDTLRRWHDRVVTMGGITYLGVLWRLPLTMQQRLLELVAVVTTGAILHDDQHLMRDEFPLDFREKLAVVLRLCSNTKALRLNTSRELILAENGCYSFKRYDAHGHAVLVALNFREEPQQIVLPIQNCASLTDAFSDVSVVCENHFTLSLKPYGFSIHHCICP